MGGQKDVRFRLSGLREQMGLDKAHIADILDISVDQYSKIESGNRGLKALHAITLADFYNVSCDYILRGIDSENVDVCSRTALDQETLAVLVDNKNKSVYDPSALKDKFALLDDIGERMKDADGDILDKLDEDLRIVETEILLAKVEANEYSVSNAFLNRLIQDERLWEELRDACCDYIMCLSELCHENKSNNGLPTVQTVYNQKGLNASRYVAGQAFANFFDKVFRDADFCRGISNLNEEDVHILRNMKLFDADTKEV